MDQETLKKYILKCVEYCELMTQDSDISILQDGEFISDEEKEVELQNYKDMKIVIETML